MQYRLREICSTTCGCSVRVVGCEVRTEDVQYRLAVCTADRGISEDRLRVWSKGASAAEDLGVRYGLRHIRRDADVCSTG